MKNEIIKRVVLLRKPDTPISPGSMNFFEALHLDRYKFETDGATKALLTRPWGEDVEEIKLETGDFVIPLQVMIYTEDKRRFGLIEGDFSWFQGYIEKNTLPNTGKNFELTSRNRALVAWLSIKMRVDLMQGVPAGV